MSISSNLRSIKRLNHRSNKNLINSIESIESTNSKDSTNPLEARNLTPGDIELDLDLGHKIINLSEKLGADLAEVFMVKGIETGFSIENDTVSFASSSTEFGLGIRVIKEKRLGFGYCTSLSQAENAIKNALKATKLAKQTDFKFGSKSTPKMPSSIFDKTILELTVENGLDFAQELISVSKGQDDRIMVTGGGVGYGGGSLGIITSLGLELAYSGTGIQGGVSTLIKDKSVSTGFEYDHSRKNDLNPTDLGEQAAELAIKGQNPIGIDPGEYPLMFTPHALAELLEFTVIPALYGEPAMKGETVYSEKIGEQIVVPGLTCYDDGLLENGINTAPFDDEGTSCKKSLLIEKGVLRKYLFDRLTGVEFNEASTGNALRSEGYGGGRNYRAPPKTRALNFTLEGQTKPYDSVISDLDNALVIHELLGAHTANPASGDFSINSPMLFKIVNGDIERAGKQVMISGNMPELMRKIIDIADDFKNVSGGLTPVALRIPSIVFEDVKII